MDSGHESKGGCNKADDTNPIQSEFPSNDGAYNDSLGVSSDTVSRPAEHGDNYLYSPHTAKCIDRIAEMDIGNLQKLPILESEEQSESQTGNTDEMPLMHGV